MLTTFVIYINILEWFQQWIKLNELMKWQPNTTSVSENGQESMKFSYYFTEQKERTFKLPEPLNENNKVLWIPFE